MSDEEIYVDEDDTEDFDIDEFNRIVSKLKKRCKSAGIEITEEDPIDEGIDYPVINMPCGREKIEFPLRSTDTIKSFLETEFEKYVCLSSYEAICSYSKGTIEALVQPLTRMPETLIWIRLFGRKKVTYNNFGELFIDLYAEKDSDLKVSLSQSSEIIQLLSRRRGTKHSLSLKIHNISVSRHDEALEILKCLANSLFFQIELSFGVPLNLERRRSRILRRRAGITGFSIEDLEFPKQEFDDAPLSIYWYGCSAQGMPLLQFLAYYQVLEYYFPAYAQAEARRRIRKIIKNPLFRSDRDVHIGKILSIFSARGSILGDERSQLKATLQECIDPDGLRDFLTKNKKQQEFFSKKQKKLSLHKLPISNPTTDLRNDVADRVYEIRCKIVHTKADSKDTDYEIILPFSNEADLLFYDIALMKYLAQHVLIAASVPIKHNELITKKS